MDLAWTTLCALLLLLPGLAFLSACSVSRSVSRETRPKSVATELGALVLLSVLVHGFLLLVFAGLTALGVSFFDVSVRGAFEALQGAKDDAAARRIADNVADHLPLLAVYVPVSIGLGILAAWPARLCLQKWFKAILSHPWVHDVVPPRDASWFVYAHVLTTTRHDGNVLCYRGPLDHFGLTGDGRFSYLVLRGPSRFYLQMQKDDACTTKPVAIGSRQFPEVPHENDLLHISGPSIENVVIARTPAPASEDLPETKEAWEKFIADVARRNLSGSGATPPPAAPPAP